MTSGILALIVLALTIVGFIAGRQRALALSSRNKQRLHSLPNYYGQSVALFIAVPAYFLLGAWLFLQPIFIESQVSAQIPDSAIPEGSVRSLVMADVRRIVYDLRPPALDQFGLVGALRAYADDIARLRADDRPTVPSKLGRELETNPFLRADDPDMQARWGGGDAVETFAALRSAKDNF